MLHAVEAGEPASLEGYVRIATALGLSPRFTMLSERAHAIRAADPVHAVMGDVQAGKLRPRATEVRIDEPYQHYQFAGRADLIAIDAARRALLHIENRTRFPDMQAFAGSYNAKRAYLADDIVRRLGWSGGARSVTHVVVALWSAEVLHTLRLRTATFRSVCPDSSAGFAAWWAGDEPPAGTSSALVVFDPLATERANRRAWVGLEDSARVAARYRDYAAAVEALRRAGRV